MNHSITHDTFFRSVFSSPETAADLLLGFLPQRLSSRIDFRSIKRLSGSFINSRLTAHIADLVFEVKTSDGNNLRFIFLLEHKSKQSNHIELQLLGYILEIFRDSLRASRTGFIVIPVVFYHGLAPWRKEKIWDRIPKRYLHFIPVFDYVMIDLSSITNKEIAGVKYFQHLRTKLAVLAQKNILDDEKIRFAVEMMSPLLSAVTLTEQDKELLAEVILYILSRSSVAERELFENSSIDILEIKETVVTTLAKMVQRGKRQGIKEGIEKGMEKGIQSFQQKIIASMLRDGEPVAKISQYTEVPIEQIKHSRTKIRKSVHR